MSRWRAQALEQAGHDVIHLEIGEPDFTTAEPVVRAGRTTCAGHTRYRRTACRLCVRPSALYRSHYGLDIDPERILVTRVGPVRCCCQQPAGRSRRHWLLADPAIRATATSCAWWKAVRSWYRSGRRPPTS